MANIIYLIGLLGCVLVSISQGNQVNSANNCRTCQCGVRPVSGRIIGGSAAQPNEFPWFVLLITAKLEPWCGSSLINDQYSLTAAHCVADDVDGRIQVANPKNYLVVFNMIDNKNNPDKFYRKVQEFIVPEKYETNHYTSDIALIKFSNRVTFSNKLYPVCLPPFDFNPDNLMGVAIGWGQTTTGPYKASDFLKKLSIPIFSNAYCMEKFKSYNAPEIESFDPNLKLCAANTTSTICSGDSGGPLAVKWKGIDVVVGIMSTSRCDADTLPDSFTRVSAFGPWISDKVSSDSCWCKALN